MHTPLVSGEAEALNLIFDVADYVFEIGDHELNNRLGNNPAPPG